MATRFRLSSYSFYLSGYSFFCGCAVSSPAHRAHRPPNTSAVLPCSPCCPFLFPAPFLSSAFPVPAVRVHRNSRPPAKIKMQSRKSKNKNACFAGKKGGAFLLCGKNVFFIAILVRFCLSFVHFCPVLSPILYLKTPILVLFKKSFQHPRFLPLIPLFIALCALFCAPPACFYQPLCISLFPQMWAGEKPTEQSPEKKPQKPENKAPKKNPERNPQKKQITSKKQPQKPPKTDRTSPAEQTPRKPAHKKRKKRGGGKTNTAPCGATKYPAKGGTQNSKTARVPRSKSTLKPLKTKSKNTFPQSGKKGGGLLQSSKKRKQKPPAHRAQNQYLNRSKSNQKHIPAKREKRGGLAAKQQKKKTKTARASRSKPILKPLKIKSKTHSRKAGKKGGGLLQSSKKKKTKPPAHHF